MSLETPVFFLLMEKLREYKLSNLDLFAGHTAYIKEIEKKETVENNKTEEDYVVEFRDFPPWLAQRINILI